MKKVSKRKEPAETTREELDVLMMFQKIQQQLISLEGKIDAFISQPRERHHERSYGRDRDRSSREGGFGERSFTRAVCAECKRECEVPFKPTGGRPVYCKDCFSKRKEGGSFGGGRDSRPRAGGFERERYGSESRGFGKRNPSTFRRRKDRD